MREDLTTSGNGGGTVTPTTRAVKSGMAVGALPTTTGKCGRGETYPRLEIGD